MSLFNPPVLLRFPVRDIHANRKALQGAQRKDLKLVWETGTSGMWNVDGVEVAVEEDGGKDEGWVKIEQITECE